MDYFNELRLRQFQEMVAEIRKASRHDYLLAKLLTVINEYAPDPAPPIRSWKEFAAFWKRWYPDELLALNRVRLGRPDNDEQALVYSAGAKEWFLQRMHAFLTDLRENRLETLNLLSDYQWALLPPPKWWFFKHFFG